MKRRLVYGIGAIILGLGTLVGCGSGSQGATSTAGASSDTSQSTQVEKQLLSLEPAQDLMETW